MKKIIKVLRKKPDEFTQDDCIYLIKYGLKNLPHEEFLMELPHIYNIWINIQRLSVKEEIPFDHDDYPAGTKKSEFA